MAHAKLTFTPSVIKYTIGGTMKVWIITEGCECGWYGGEIIKGAYSTEKKAKDALDKMPDNKYLDITELEVE
jgi:hypothetical protein